jgi:UDP-hydrolysing UDP-N-acetyl-D-glucosamine 2-epimerase
MKKRVIAVFTGNRAEYRLQYPILKAIDEHPELDYQLIVSGAHLDPHFGNTVEEIISDGFRIDAEVKIEMDATSLYCTTQAIGSGILSMGQALDKLKPDMLVVYADRFEGLAAVVAGSQMNIPVAHIEGGDLTEGGALDDSVRHAMSKLSHLHFTTNQQASNRILGMGEESWRVHTVGFPAIDLIMAGKVATPDEIVERFNLDLQKPILLFTQHSVTTEFNHAAEQIAPSLAAMERLAKEEDCQVLLTYPNNDAGGSAIIDELKRFDNRKIDNIQLHRSLGQYFYHGVLALAKDGTRKVVCVGNSSSGIKETPAFGCPTINIGSRQQGRLRGENVEDVPYSQDMIVAAVKQAISDENYRQSCHKVENPYYLGGAGVKVAKVLAEVTMEKELLRKRMTLEGKVKNGWYS